MIALQYVRNLDVGDKFVFGFVGTVDEAHMTSYDVMYCLGEGRE
jgi:hypothetical protein